MFFCLDIAYDIMLLLDPITSSIFAQDSPTCTLVVGFPPRALNRCHPGHLSSPVMSHEIRRHESPPTQSSNFSKQSGKYRVVLNIFFVEIPFLKRARTCLVWLSLPIFRSNINATEATAFRSPARTAATFEPYKFLVPYLLGAYLKKRTSLS